MKDEERMIVGALAVVAVLGMVRRRSRKRQRSSTAVRETSRDPLLFEQYRRDPDDWVTHSPWGKRKPGGYGGIYDDGPFSPPGPLKP